MENQNFPPILAVAAIVTSENGSVLLRRRTKEPDRGKWEIFAGYIEPGERLVEAVKRKLKEKGAISEVQSVTFTGRYYDEPGRHLGTVCIPFVFSAKVSSSNVLESENVRWFSPEEVLKLDLALDNTRMVRDSLV